ncbi:MAG: hypothetical protein ACKO85_21420, partial [Isosphaeraceae bacterium]
TGHLHRSFLAWNSINITSFSRICQYLPYLAGNTGPKALFMQLILGKSANFYSKLGLEQL